MVNTHIKQKHLHKCFITSAKEVMFLPVFVCPFVSKITQKVMDGSF